MLWARISWLNALKFREILPAFLILKLKFIFAFPWFSGKSGEKESAVTYFDFILTIKKSLFQITTKKQKSDSQSSEWEVYTYIELNRIWKFNKSRIASVRAWMDKQKDGGKSK